MDGFVYIGRMFTEDGHSEVTSDRGGSACLGKVE